MIIAAADGSSLRNPGPSGWAWYVNDACWAADGWAEGTNNQGELRAVLDLLQQTAGLDEPLKILCDSQYVINSVTRWLPGWKAKGWRKGDGKPVSNVELLHAIDAELQGRAVSFEWVKGHAGHDMNEAADQRARGAAIAVQQGREVSRGPGFNLAAALGVSSAPDQPLAPAAAATDSESQSRPEVANCAGMVQQQFDLFSHSEPVEPGEQEQIMANQAGATGVRAGFIGAGNMGSAILRRAVDAGIIDAAGSRVHDHCPEAAEQLAGQTGVKVAASNAEAVRDAQLVVLAVKPVNYAEVIAEIADVLPGDAVVLSISPAHSIAAVRELLGRDVAIARAMPNTPALIGQGAAGVCFGPGVNAAQQQLVKDLLGALGLVLTVREDQFPALTGVSGSSPAYVYMMIEALAQGAIKGGIPGPDAYQLAAAAVEGAAAMVRQSGKHPAQLRDEVCSAGGTTIAAVAALEQAGFAGAVIEAVDVAAQRAVEMGS